MAHQPTAQQQATLAQLRASVAQVEAGGQDHRPAPDEGHQAAESLAGPPKTADGDDYAKARAVVLRKLTGSPKSRHQLAQALAERDFAEEIIESVLDRMEEVQLIDDAEFARTWVRTRHELKGLGSAALRQELQQRGVGKEHIEAALFQLSAADEDAAAVELIDNKLRGVVVPVGTGPEDRKEIDKITRRLVGMLARRGHHPSAALRLVRDAIEARRP